MQRFRSLLVLIDGDPSRQPVLTRAARLAKQNGAAVRLVSVVEDFPWYARLVLPNAEELQSVLVHQKSEALAGLAAPLRNEGLEVTTSVLRGRRYLELVREVLKGKHDLLMKEAEPNQDVSFGSTDMNLLRCCPCPLWLFKPQHVGQPFARILAAVDPAPPPDDSIQLHIKAELAPRDGALDARILEIADSLARREGAELHVVHAWSAIGERLLRGDLTLDQEQIERYVDDSRHEAQTALNRLLEKFPNHAGRTVHFLKGDAADVIADQTATLRIDLIVMGTVARTGIPSLVIGNTAETVLQRVDCSVLAIKPDGFVSPVQPLEP